MKKLTAEELLRKTSFNFEAGHFEETIEFMNQFAKQAVEYALEQAASKAKQKININKHSVPVLIIDKASILSLKDQIFKDLNLNK